MVINDVIILKNVLKDTKIGKVSNDALRKYLKLSIVLNKYNNEWEEKRKELYKETADAKGLDLQTLTEEQNNEIFTVIAPVLNEYLGTEVTDLDTKIFSWDEICEAILNVSENTNLTVDQKSMLTQMLCYEEL